MLWLTGGVKSLRIAEFLKKQNDSPKQKKSSFDRVAG